MNNLNFASDEYVDQDYFLTTKNISSEKKAEKSDNKIRIIKVIFGIFCFLLLCELVVFKYVMPSLSSPKLTISGQKVYSAEEIAKKLIPMNATSWFDFDVNEAAAILSSDSAIENVVVQKKFPDKILINVIERSPVAVTFVSEKGRTFPVNVDKNGILFPCNSKINNTEKTIPIISGLPVEYMTYGRRVPSKYKTLIDQIAEINELPQNYFASISEICVKSKEYGNYELALIPSQSKVKVLTDRALNEDALKYMMIVLDVVNQLGNDVYEVDLRYGAVAFRTKSEVEQGIE